jgi:hypothetical protein
MNSRDINTLQLWQANFDEPAVEALGIPHLLPFLNMLRAKQAAASEVTGRWYQAEALRRGKLEMPSIWTGQPVIATSSAQLVDLTIVYRFADEPDMWLVTGGIGEGAPIDGVYIPSRSLLVNLGHEIWGTKPDQIREAETIFGARPADTLPAARLVVLTGNPSFAHHIWNQLGALDHLAVAEGFRDKPLDIVAVQEPLGPIKALFSDCPHWKVRYISRNQLSSKSVPTDLYYSCGRQIGDCRGGRPHTPPDLERHREPLPHTA